MGMGRGEVRGGEVKVGSRRGEMGSQQRTPYSEVGFRFLRRDWIERLLVLSLGFAVCLFGNCGMVDVETDRWVGW